jgi:hypothetical protein
MTSAARVVRMDRSRMRACGESSQISVRMIRVPNVWWSYRETLRTSSRGCCAGYLSERERIGQAAYEQELQALKAALRKLRNGEPCDA